MIVRSLLDERKIVYTCPGNEYRTEYIRVDDPDGKVYLKETGKVNIKDEINSNRPVSVAEYINRYMRGDVSALGDPTGAQYGDVSGIRDLSTLVDLAQTVDFLPVNLTEAASASIPESEVKSDAES